jgi:hypothetical protein
MKGVGRALFVAILLMIVGTLNIIYGFAAIGNSHYFSGSTYLLTNLHTWGWLTVVVGIIQLTAGLSLAGGRAYGQFIGIAAAMIGSIEALLSISSDHPFWSLGVFAVCLWILHGLLILGEPVTE